MWWYITFFYGYSNVYHNGLAKLVTLPHNTTTCTYLDKLIGKPIEENVFVIRCCHAFRKCPWKGCLSISGYRWPRVASPKGAIGSVGCNLRVCCHDLAGLKSPSRDSWPAWILRCLMCSYQEVGRHRSLGEVESRICDDEDGFRLELCW